MKTLWIVLAAAIALPTPAEAIPLIEPPQERSSGKVRRRRRNPAAKLKARIKSLEALKDMVVELKKWSRDIERDLERMYKDSKRNFELARAKIFRAKGKAVTAYNAPRGLEAETARASDGKKYPRLRYTVPTVKPDDFNLHVKVTVPKAWVNQRKIKLQWYIFDYRHLPTAATYQAGSKAIYYHYQYYYKPIPYAATIYRHQVRGLELLPGRYFIAVVVRATNGPYPRPKTVSLGVFRVKGKNPPGVKTMLPHYRRWYSSYRSPLTLKVKTRTRRNTIYVSGRVSHAKYSKGMEPVYIEVRAESGYRKKVVYRVAKRLKRGKARIKGHGLPAGSYKLRIRVYTKFQEQSGSRYKYMATRTKYVEQLENVTLP